MTQVDAIYHNGVFTPLHDVELAEDQRVRLSIEPIGNDDAAAWLARVQVRKQRIVTERGPFPDSTADIAEDRRR